MNTIYFEHRFAILDVYKSRMEVCGDVEQCATWVVQHCVPARKALLPSSGGAENHHHHPRGGRHDSLHSYRRHNYTSVTSGSGAKPKTNNANAVDRDNNASDGVKAKKSKGSSSPSLTKRSRDSKDSGYGSKAVSKELPEVVPGRLRSDEIAPEDLYGHGKQVQRHFKPFCAFRPMYSQI